MPPNEIAIQENKTLYRRLLRRPIQQRFYPQCQPCSNRQGGLIGQGKKNFNKVRRASLRAQMLKKSGGGLNAHMHGLRPRIQSMTGGLISMATIYKAKDVDILGHGGGNRRRFDEWQSVIEDELDDLYRKIFRR